MLVVLNAAVLGDSEFARQVSAVLQACTSIGAIGYGLLVAGRVNGASRMWRLLAVAAVAGFAAGELTWWAAGDTAAPIGDSGADRVGGPVLSG